MTNAPAHRAIYSRANGGVAHLSTDELWDTIEQARETGDDALLDKANQELERRQRNADLFTRRAENSIVLAGATAVAGGVGLAGLGLWKLCELCFGL